MSHPHSFEKCSLVRLQFVDLAYLDLEFVLSLIVMFEKSSPAPNASERKLKGVGALEL